MKTKQQTWISIAILLGTYLMLTTACKKDTVPQLTTADITGINQCMAICVGDVTSDGGSQIAYRGVCWSTEQMPTIADNKTSDGIGYGPLESIITGLSANTTYYVRAYATNNTGTGYGNEVSFTTDLRITGTVTDIDGNIYNTITIDNTEWMVENLKTTKYNNGDLIGTTTPETLDISDQSTPKYQWAYDGDENNVATYGRLYTFYAAIDSRGICPTGWHTATEWSTIVYYTGGYDYNDGGRLKETGTTHWNSPNTGATNIIGFNALPGGYRNETGEFKDMGNIANWWYSGNPVDNTKASYAYITYRYAELFYSNMDKKMGASLRCVRDL